MNGNEEINLGGRPPKDNPMDVVNTPVRFLVSGRILDIIVKEQEKHGLEPQSPGRTGKPKVSSDIGRLPLYRWLQSLGYMEDPEVAEDDTWRSLRERGLV